MNQIMPIQGCKQLKSIPMGMMLPHERQAVANHNQSLHRIAERGGLSVREALYIIEGKQWTPYSPRRDATAEEIAQLSAMSVDWVES